MGNLSLLQLDPKARDSRWIRARRSSGTLQGKSAGRLHAYLNSSLGASLDKLFTESFKMRGGPQAPPIVTHAQIVRSKMSHKPSAAEAIGVGLIWEAGDLLVSFNTLLLLATIYSSAEARRPP